VSSTSSSGRTGKGAAVEEQGRHWSRQAARYDEVFLDPFRPGVENPCLDHLLAVPDPGSKSVIDLGCGTGPLLPHLINRFGSVTALDFAPGMIKKARARLGPIDAAAVTFLTRSMAEIDDLAGRFDVVVAINSIVMPDERAIDRAMAGVRSALRPGGVFLGVMPAMDAIHYHTLLLRDRALDRGDSSEEADRHAAFHAEHVYYDFAFGRFLFQNLRQKFWQPFELEYRLRKAGFGSITLEKVLYPWDDHITGGPEFADQPRSWDWSFVARA
jgi:SAM-dependent methyltransferase